jgi:hypothetical protein
MYLSCVVVAGAADVLSAAPLKPVYNYLDACAFNMCENWSKGLCKAYGSGAALLNFVYYCANLRNELG